MHDYMTATITGLSAEPTTAVAIPIFFAPSLLLSHFTHVPKSYILSLLYHSLSQSLHPPIRTFLLASFGLHPASLARFRPNLRNTHIAAPSALCSHPLTGSFRLLCTSPELETLGFSGPRPSEPAILHSHRPERRLGRSPLRMPWCRALRSVLPVFRPLC